MVVLLFLFLSNFDSPTLGLGCFEGLMGPVLRKSESLKPECGAEEVERPMEEAKEATSDFRRSSSCVGSGFFDFEIAIVVSNERTERSFLLCWSGGEFLCTTRV